MKILLLSPIILDIQTSLYNNKIKSFFHRVFSSNDARSLSLPILAAVTPDEHEVDIIKMPPNKIKIYDEYDLVGIRTTTTDCLYAYRIADEYRKKGVPVVIGGWHASALPKEAKEHADSVVVGEAEELWPQLLKDFSNGELKPFYYQKTAVETKNIPVPISKISKGFSHAVQATRGCPYQCDFCPETIMHHRKYFRKRPIDIVSNEIKSIPSKRFVFHDATLTADVNYTKELFRSIKKYKKHFFCNGNADVLSKDDELLELAKEAGCHGWLIGFESISKESLKSIGKTTNKVKTYKIAINKIHEHNMMVSGSFMFGFDTDTIDIFERTKEFALSSGIDFPDAVILTPFPGTPVYNRLKEQGRILTYDWFKYDHRHVVFQPKNMTPDELFFNTKKVFDEFFSIKNITKRNFKSLKLGVYPFIATISHNLTFKTLELSQN